MGSNFMELYLTGRPSTPKGRRCPTESHRSEKVESELLAAVGVLTEPSFLSVVQARSDQVLNNIAISMSGSEDVWHLRLRFGVSIARVGAGGFRAEISKWDRAILGSFLDRVVETRSQVERCSGVEVGIGRGMAAVLCAPDDRVILEGGAVQKPDTEYPDGVDESARGNASPVLHSVSLRCIRNDGRSPGTGR